MQLDLPVRVEENLREDISTELGLKVISQTKKTEIVQIEEKEVREGNNSFFLSLPVSGCFRNILLLSSVPFFLSINMYRVFDHQQVY